MITQLTAITIATGLVLVLVIVGVLIFLFRFVERWRNKGNKDAQRYLLMEEFSDTILMEYDCIHDVMRFTPNAAAMFGSRPGAGVVVRDCKNSLFTHGLVYYGDYAVVQSVLSGERKEAQPEIRIRIKDQAGNYYWVMAKYKYIYEGNRLVSIVGKIVDIDEQQRYEDELRQRAQQDGMTELYNKLTTVNLIKQSLYEDASGSLLVLDIDNFKRINDTYGHTTGDEVIQAVAQRVRSSFRYDDIVGRIGGDELVVFMRKTTERSIIEHRLETLRSLMNDYTENHKVELTLSVGIACAPDDGSRYEELFNNADRAMYEAKRLGKDGHCFSQDVSAHVEQ